MKPETSSARAPQSMLERTTMFVQKIVEPHRSIKDQSEKQRVILLNSLTLLAASALIFGLLFNHRALLIYGYFLPIAALAYIAGKSRYSRIGVFLMSVSLLASAFITLYRGLSNNFILTALTITPISLVLVHALVSHKSFAWFALFTVSAAFSAQIYSKTLILSNDAARVGGILLAMSVVLYGVSANRARARANYQNEAREKDDQLSAAEARAQQEREEHQRQLEAFTEQVRQREKNLRQIAEISQELALNATKPLSEFLTYAAQHISQQTGYYHIGIFLLDKKREYAELRAANSAGGERMLARNHQLKIGGTGIVGYVSQSGFPRIALSTGADAVFFNNPDLPNTQSEMALPMKVGDQIIGVLDIQSEAPAAFNETDTDIFSILANQLALTAVEPEDGEITLATKRQETARAPQSGGKISRQGYAYQADGTIALATESDSPLLQRVLRAGNLITAPASSQNEKPAIAVPVKIRDSVVGYLQVEATERNRTWTEDEIALVQSISERAALALENARLFKEANRRAEQEQLMAKVTTRIGASFSFEQILQTTIQELGRALGVKRAFIQMDAPKLEPEEEVEGNA